MKHSIIVEILTVGMFLRFGFDWTKLIVRSKLAFRRFFRSHIALRINSNFDLDALGPVYGREISDPICDPKNRTEFFLLTSRCGCTFREVTKEEYLKSIQSHTK